MKKHLQKLISHKVSSNFVLIGMVCGVQAINSIVLARHMDKDSFGQYSFLFNAIVPLLSHIIILGQNNSIVRTFSKGSIWDFDWRRYLKNISLIFLAITALSVGIIGAYYNLKINLQLFLFACLISNIMLFVGASISRSQRQYNFSVFIEKGAPLFFLPLMAAAFWLGKTDVSNLAVSKTFSYIIPAAIVCFVIFRNKGTGNTLKPINKSIYTDGILLWAISLTMLTINRIDNFFLVKLISYDAVATYCVLFTFSQLYDIANQAIWSVYSQKFASPYKPNTKRFLVILVSIGALISLFYLFFGAPLLHFLFKGKYDSGLELLLPFCIIGCLKIIYVYPSCHFIGKSQTKTLKKFFAYNLVVVAVKFVLTIVMIKAAGLMGCLMGGIIVWVMRNAAGYWLVYTEKKALLKTT